MTFAHIGYITELIWGWIIHITYLPQFWHYTPKVICTCRCNSITQSSYLCCEHSKRGRYSKPSTPPFWPQDSAPLVDQNLPQRRSRIPVPRSSLVVRILLHLEIQIIIQYHDLNMFHEAPKRAVPWSARLPDIILFQRCYHFSLEGHLLAPSQAQPHMTMYIAQLEARSSSSAYSSIDESLLDVMERKTPSQQSYYISVLDWSNCLRCCSPWWVQRTARDQRRGRDIV